MIVHIFPMKRGQGCFENDQKISQTVEWILCIRICVEINCMLKIHVRVSQNVSSSVP